MIALHCQSLTVAIREAELAITDTTGNLGYGSDADFALPASMLCLILLC